MYIIEKVYTCEEHVLWCYTFHETSKRTGESILKKHFQPEQAEQKQSIQSQKQYVFVLENKRNICFYEDMCQCITESPEKAWKIVYTNDNGHENLISWHIHQDFQHLVHLRSKRYYYQGEQISGKYTILEIENIITKYPEQKHLIWQMESDGFIEWSKHPCISASLKQKTSPLYPSKNVHKQNNNSKYDNQDSHSIIPTTALIGIPLMREQDRNKILARISEYDGVWKLQELELVVAMFWKIVLSDCLAESQKTTSQRGHKGHNLSRFGTFYEHKNEIYIRMSSYIRRQCVEQNTHELNRLPWGDKKEDQVSIWSSIMQRSPNVQLSMRRKLILRIVQETQLDLWAVHVYFQYYEAHILHCLFHEGHMSLEALGFLELFVSNDESKIYFFFHNSDFLHLMIARYKQQIMDDEICI